MNTLNCKNCHHYTFGYCRRFDTLVYRGGGYENRLSVTSNRESELSG